MKLMAGWLLIVVCIMGVIATGTSATTGAVRTQPPLLFSITSAQRESSSARRSTFLSVVPVCGCTERTVIAAFSVRTGRKVRTLATIRSDGQISQAASDGNGDLWMTFTTGPYLAEPPIAGGDPQPDTCASALVRFDPRTGMTTTIRRFPASETVGNAVPSPNGRRVAVLEGGCATSYFDEHIVVIDVRTRASIPIGVDATPCHSLFNVAWSANGTRLVFPYGPSVLPRTTTFQPSDTCESPRWNRLAIVSALHPSSSRNWTLWAAQRHCSYESAAFDTTGIAASEGCTTGAPATQFNDPDSGRAYLVQLNLHGQRQARFPLRIAYEAGDVVDDPHTGHVLVSEDEGGNLGIKYYQWVWDFSGHKLRLVGHYRTQGITEIIAQPAARQMVRTSCTT